MNHCQYCHHITQTDHVTHGNAWLLGLHLPDVNPYEDLRFDEYLDSRLSDLASESSMSCTSSWSSSRYLDTESEASFFPDTGTTLGSLIGIQAIPRTQENQGTVGDNYDKYKFMVSVPKEGGTRKNMNAEANGGYMSLAMIKVRALIACGGAQRKTTSSLAQLLKKGSTRFQHP